MKKLVTTDIAIGSAMPIKKGTLEHIQSAFYEPIDYICRSIFGTTSGVNVLYGCVNSTPVGTTYTVSAGAVYYAGEVYLVDAVTATRSGNVLVATIATTYFTDVTADPVTFTDSVTHSVHSIRKVVLALGTSGSGIADYTALNSDRWHTIGSTFGEVTEPAFVNSWANVGGVTTVGRFKKEKNGFVVLEGTLTGGATNTAAFTLPTGFRPTLTHYFVTSSPGSEPNNTNVSITSAGVVTIKYEAGTPVSLDGIRFPVD